MIKKRTEHLNLYVNVACRPGACYVARNTNNISHIIISIIKRLTLKQSIYFYSDMMLLSKLFFFEVSRKSKRNSRSKELKNTAGLFLLSTFAGASLRYSFQQRCFPQRTFSNKL